MVVGGDDLEGAQGFVVECDAERSSLFDFVDVLACDGIEFLEECGSDDF